MIWTEWPWMGDVQRRPPLGACARCGSELYWYDEGEICAQCKEELYGSQETG